MTEEAGSIGVGGALTERIQVPEAADELGRLAETLNGMLARLERSVTQQRRFVANASHELRTGHARHYCTNDLDERLEAHRSGRGARLMEVITLSNSDRSLRRRIRSGIQTSAGAASPLC